MGYIEHALNRANIQDLRAFFLHGVDAIGIHKEPFEKRLDDATASMYIRLKILYSDAGEQQDAINDFNYALSVYEEVYTEVGMKMATRLILDLLQSNSILESK